jgi:threonine dehydratase
LIAETGGNLVGVEHHREGAGVKIGEVEVILQVETRGRPHINELVETLTRHGYPVTSL